MALHRLRPGLAAPLVFLAFLIAGSTTQGQIRAPRLIVLLVVDQMRADYIDKYQQQWTGGLHRLLAESARYRQANYPYANTVTCAGHASISTGSLPSVHGMIGNTWFDRALGRVVTCVEDPAVTEYSYGKPTDAVGESGFRLTAPTFADELRAQLDPAPRIASFSLKARAAIPLGGQHPDAIAWVTGDAWVSSTAFSEGSIPEVADYVAAHPVERQLWRTWERALPDSDYLYEETAVGVRTDAWPKAFPHVIQTWDDWQNSPLSDEYLAHMAVDVAGHLDMGRAGHTDLLAISFSALDLVGHIYGPNSHEVQDVLIRLDRSIGDLLTSLDRLVGPGNYLVALSADHGVAPTPERGQAFGLDAWRVPARAIPDAAQKAIAAELGRGRHVNRLMGSDLYLADGVLDSLRERPGAIARVRNAIAGVAGVRAVYARDDLTPERQGVDPLARQLAGSFVPSRSGDLFVVLKPYWLVGGAGGTSHGTSYEYDTHVPLLLAGPGIAAGDYLTPATPLDIAPTLAYLTGITLPNAQGHILVDAVRARDASRGGRTEAPPADRTR